ncbi:exo-alpha-sialidase [bacterium]|nr:MAG: exo-alpha-sialidase [bacterium]
MTIGAGLALAVGLTPVFASVSVTPPVQVLDHPLAVAGNPTCTALVAQELSALPTARNYLNAEVEPWIAATGDGRYIGAFQQDRWSDGGANGLTVALFDGTSWKLAASQPKFSICAGAAQGTPGHRQRATDPWITVTPDGTAYVISDSFDATGPGFGGPSTILISRSTDGGDHWGDPVSVELDSGAGVLNDKESITADPTNANNVYAVWDKLINPSLTASFDAFNHTFAFKGPAMFARTTDGGKTWSQGREIFDPGEFNQTIGNQILVEPDGVLVDVFDLINNEHGPRGHNATTTFQVAVITSHDQGNTWSAPTIVASIVDTPINTLDGHAIRTGDILPEAAVNPTNGKLYVAWQTDAKVDVSQSADDGAMWSPAVTISRSAPAQAFTPSIGVAADGTVGVSYYDLRHATSAHPGNTDTWFDTCSSACTSAAAWSEAQLDTSGGFDMKAAPLTGSGFFVGDYESIAPSGAAGFRPLWVMARPGTSADPTNPFSSTVNS